MKEKVNLFLLCFKKGRKREGNFLRIFFFEKKDLKEAKIFPVIPKKLINLAVKRNKIKRWIREAMREKIKKFFRKGIFIIFLKKHPEDLNFQKVKKEINNILENVKFF